MSHVSKWYCQSKDFGDICSMPDPDWAIFVTHTKCSFRGTGREMWQKNMLVSIKVGRNKDFLVENTNLWSRFRIQIVHCSSHGSLLIILCKQWHAKHIYIETLLSPLTVVLSHVGTFFRSQWKFSKRFVQPPHHLSTHHKINVSF